MCRHLAWLGRPRTLASLVLEPPHGLLTQSYAPRRQRYGRLNADGWGVGLYAEQRPEPARWRSSRPLWQDTSFESIAPLLSAGCVLAAVRSATPGMPIEETASAPFAYGPWLLSHNGRVDRRALPSVPTAESCCDSALLAAAVFARGPGAVGELVPELAEADPAARLNLLLTDGGQILATTWGDTLSYLVDESGVVVASEPYDDDPGWVDVPDQHLLHASGEGISLTALSEAR